MLRGVRIALVLGAPVVAGCAFKVNVEALAPPRPATTFVEILNGPPPPGSVPLAKLHAQGNNYQNASDCVTRLQSEARQLGADLVRVQPEASGFGQGPACVGVAYALPVAPGSNASARIPDSANPYR